MKQVQLSNSESFWDTLPEGWAYDRLKDVVALRTGKTKEKSEIEDYLELEDIESGKGIILNWRNTLEVESAVTLFKTGDVLFGKLRPYLEKYYLAERDGKCTGEILAFKPEKVHSRFLIYVIASPWFIKKSSALAYGAKMPRINWATQLGQFSVPLPPPTEQERIANYLDASCAAIDAAVAAKRSQLDTLGSLRKSIIAETVTKGLNSCVSFRPSDVTWFKDIPRHWKCGHLKRFVTRIQTGTTPPTENPDYYFDGTVPWFAPGSFHDELDLKDPKKLINVLAIHEGFLRLFPAQSVFFVGIGATIGKTGIIGEIASCNQQIIGIVTNHQMMGRYLAYLLQIYQDIIPGIAIATTLPIFDQVKTGYLPVLQPPFNEQLDICEFLDKKLAEIRNIVTLIESQIDTLIDYRKSLIHECVTGQRRITAEDVTRAKKTLEQAAE